MTWAPFPKRPWPSSTAAATGWLTQRQVQLTLYRGNAVARWIGWGAWSAVALNGLLPHQCYMEITARRCRQPVLCSPAALQDVATLLRALPSGAVVYSQLEQDYEHIDFTWCVLGDRAPAPGIWIESLLKSNSSAGCHCLPVATACLTADAATASDSHVHH